MHENGHGFQQNFEKAAKYYEEAAKDGFASAQYNLARLYEYGDGVPLNARKAAKWYKRAAKQGHSKAQAALNEYYRTLPPIGRLFELFNN